jgi:multisubunit Na+/H+ antiporter MnhF subunit
VNGWMVGAIALLIGLVPCAFVCVRGSPAHRLVAYELAGIVEALVLIVLAQALHREVFFDLGVVLAFLSLAGGLVFAHFFERWI